jgi:hypothetical protein
MRMRNLVAMGAALALALGTGHAAQDETFDLRGPAVEKGQVFVSKGKMVIKEADTTMTIGGQDIALKMNLTVNSVEEAKVLAVKGRDVTKCQVKIVKEEATVSGSLMGMDLPEMTEPAELNKETVISEKVDGKWKHALVDTKPTAKQKKELDNRNGLENDDDLYPADKVKVGHKWTVDAAALQKMLGNSFTDVKGKVNQVFKKTEELNGETVAVIESETKITGKMKDDGEPTVDVEMELKITTWKSLKTGIAVKEKFSGKIKLDGKVDMDGMKVQMKMSGPITGESTTEKK